MLTLAQIRVTPENNRYGIDDFILDVVEGDPFAWVALGSLAAFVGFLALRRWSAGRSLTEDDEGRHHWSHRGTKHVIWEYDADDD